ncbi:MAG: hypothetical protein HOB56_02775 [Proteobacteria bacterium]|jgi:hypothetical protein|nr:hypothetical protein [Pseudomonadota bacterium]MBT5624610.1 hypothetical protein [Pseudomonadota bacterium]MBT6656682.1 hypothetical protein [Pseudomonadota bacterium]
MILIWSVVVLLVILGGWVLWEGLKAQTFHSVHMDSLPELRERLGQPHVDDKGRSWTNVATFEIWEAFVMGWEGTTDELIDWLSEGESSKGQIFTVKEFEKLFSVDELRSSELEHFLHFNNEDRTWDLGESTYDLKIYRDLWDYDQLSERFVEWFEDEYPEGIEACEPE